MEYISLRDAAVRWGLDPSNLGKLCRKGAIEGAKLVGKSWLIPDNAPKPADGRTKQARAAAKAEDFRFPLLLCRGEKRFCPPLSPEEARLRQAQADFYACEFEKASGLFHALAENAESIYVKVCALFYLCVLTAVYDTKLNWDGYYYRLLLLLSGDFPRKKEMELFLPWLDVIVGQFGRVPEKLNTDAAYEYHPSAWYLNAYLSVFNFDVNDAGKGNIACAEPFATLCRLMESDGHYVEAQALHLILAFYFYGAHVEDAMLYHLRRAVRLAYDHELLFPIADAEAYYADAVNTVLSEYPEAFAERIHKNSLLVYQCFSRFAGGAEKASVYEKLTGSDYRYVFYAIGGITTAQAAKNCGVSLRSAMMKYREIYEKLGVKGKKELIAEMRIAFGTRE